MIGGQLFLLCDLSSKHGFLRNLSNFQNYNFEHVFVWNFFFVPSILEWILKRSFLFLQLGKLGSPQIDWNLCSKLDLGLTEVNLPNLLVNRPEFRTEELPSDVDESLREFLNLVKQKHLRNPCWNEFNFDVNDIWILVIIFSYFKLFCCQSVYFSGDDDGLFMDILHLGARWGIASQRHLPVLLIF